MAYLEYVPQNSELRKEFEDILSLPQKENAKDGLAMRGKALRNILSRWSESISQSFIRDVNTAIDFTIIPIIGGQKPEMPDPKAFDSANSDQMNKFKELTVVAFDALDKYHQSRKLYEFKTPKELDPLNRYMALTEMLNRFVKRLSSPKVKQVDLINQSYFLQDDGIWPGHMIAQINPNANNRAKEISALTRYEDMPSYNFYIELPEKVKPIMKSENSNTTEILRTEPVKSVKRQTRKKVTEV